MLNAPLNRTRKTVMSWSWSRLLLDLLMRAARWLLVLVSMGPGPSELRVARGLATGALDFPLVSPVQRRINCSVGPWENVSNGGSLCEEKQTPLAVTHGGFQPQDRLKSTQKRCTFPSRMVSHVARFLLMGLSSIPCIDTSYSPSSSCSLLWTTSALISRWLLTEKEKRSSNLKKKTHTCFYQRPSSAQHKSPSSLPPPCGMSFSSFEQEYPKHLCANTSNIKAISLVSFSTTKLI